MSGSRPTAAMDIAESQRMLEGRVTTACAVPRAGLFAESSNRRIKFLLRNSKLPFYPLNRFMSPGIGFLFFGLVGREMFRRRVEARCRFSPVSNPSPRVNPVSFVSVETYGI